MRRLLLGAVRARRAQLAAVLLLAALAVTTVTVASMLTGAVVADARLAQVQAHPPSVTAKGSLPRSAVDDVDLVRNRLVSAAALGFSGEATVSNPVLVTGPTGASGVELAAVDGACAHVQVEGSCAGGAVAPAGLLGLRPGDEISVRAGPDTPAVRLQVVGVYKGTGAILVDRATVAALRTPSVSVTIRLLGGDVATDPARLRSAAAAVTADLPAGFTLTEELTELADRLDEAQFRLGTVITVGTAPVLVVAALALLLVLARAAEQQRPETALAALRGAPLRPRLLFAIGPTALTVVAATPVGFALGVGASWLAARILLGGRVDAPLTGVTVFAAAAAGLALIVLTVGVQWWLHRRPLALSLRSTPPRHRARWATTGVDLIVALLAAAAAYQAITDPGRGLAPLAPALIVLALGLLAARLVVPAAAASGASLLRRGRLAPALAALSLVRRPGAHATVALVAVTTALVGQAGLGFVATERSVSRQARLELGADRILHIGETSDAALIAAVQAADPQGQWAMAVSRQVPGADAGGRTVLAVQSDRLARVAQWPDEPGIPTAVDVTRMLRAPSNPVARVDGDTLLLDVSSSSAADIVAQLATDTGRLVEAVFAVDSSRRTYSALVDCKQGCRFASLAVSNATVRLHGLRQSTPDRDVIASAEFGAPGRFRRTDGGALSYGPDGLGVTATDATARLLAVDAAWPLPVVAVDDQAPPADVAVLGARPASVEIARSVPSLPGLDGGGLLVDYELAVRATGGVEHPAEQPQVWLAAGTPAAVEAALRDRLDVRAVTSLGEIESSGWRRAAGPAYGLGLLTAGLALAVLTVGLLATGLAERPRRRGEVRALRIQGLSAATASASVRLRFLALVLLGTVVGLVSLTVVSGVTP